MAKKELASVVVIMASCVVMLMEVPVYVSGSLEDTDLEESVRDTADIGDNLPELIRLLQAVLTTRNENKVIKSLANGRLFRSAVTGVTPYKKSELSSLLHALSLNPDEPNDFLTSQRRNSYQDIPLLTSKRAREEVFGAMPPLTEFCRMMGVKCY
uniref:Uncharacterized protein n=1 Tax=Arion vulgaris TaxID=1028688 RepID=A0A0B6ZNW5_9EUPU